MKELFYILYLALKGFCKTIKESSLENAIPGNAIKSPYDVLDVAYYIVSRMETISNLRIQKVLYFVQLFYLRETGKCFFKEDIEAWKFGPAIPIVYREFMIFGDMPILISPENAEESRKKISKSDQQFIDDVLKKTNKFNLRELIEITCSHKAWADSYPRFDSKITIEMLLREIKNAEMRKSGNQR